jgi:2-beta-glucuronyltransferase
MNKYFYHYSRKVPKQLLRWIGESDVVLMESGGPEIFFDIVRVTNPRCKIIYICSDALETIGCATYVLDEFRRVVRHFDGVRIPSRLLSSAFPKDCKLYFVPHGLDPDSLKTSAPSPYTGGANIVSVGNMLFDPQFFETAAKLFPEVHFHVIGGGRRARNLAASNITVYGEMPFKETLPYIKYADAGVAPYDDDRVSPYLTDTSMKLMQYNYFGLPAICPAVLAGGHQSRFGYIREKPNSIQDAVARALSCGPFQGSTYLTWAEVTQRILFPERFPETFLN